nr:YfhO family protein [Clostridia bacterium]
FDFLANHLASLDTTIRSSGDIVLPNVYCTMATVVIAPMYFFCKKISYKKKIAAVIVLIFFYASFVLNYINFLWHGLHFPNDLPFRWSYMYSFFLILLAYNALTHIRSFDAKHILLCAGAIFAFIIVVQKVEQKNVSTSTVYISLAFTAVFALLYVVMSSRRWARAATELFLLCAVMTEIVVADTGHYNVSQSKTAYAGDYYQYQEIRELTEIEDSTPFYRTELSALKARMDPCWYGYNGASTFSSMAYEPMSKLQRKLGMYGNNINSYTYNPQTPVYNTMNAIKYIYDKADYNYLKEDGVYTKKFTNDKFTSYEYKYFLPIAYCVSSDILDWDTGSGTPIDVQNDYISTAAGVSGVYEFIPIDSIEYDNVNQFYPSEITNGSFTYYKTNSSEDYCGVTIQITMPKAQRLCLYVDCKDLKNATISSESYAGTRNFDEPMVLDLGEFQAGEIVDITLSITESDSGSIKFRAAGLNMSKFVSAYNTFVGNGVLNISSFSDTRITGSINAAAEAGVLYTSIPYDHGWKAYIDGVDRSDEIVEIGGAYMGLNVPSGQHSIELRFTPKGVLPGLVLTALTTAALIAAAVIFKKKKDLLTGKLSKFAPIPATYYVK